MEIHHRVGSIFWLIIGIYFALSAFYLGLGSLRQPGPGFVFFLASLLLISLSTIDLAGTFIGKPKTDRDEKHETIWMGTRWSKVLLVVIGILLYTCVFNFLGFLLSTFLLMVLLFKAVDPTKWFFAILGSLITISIAYCIFKLWLDVPFPTGVLGF